ncbi:hypothetical protein HanXRQr2_Chr14g0661561 [Helianthus annuus]|uniref:Uncharacterized protein n=1 Tax=Helianthus annuus TaxID=4232 RepID=A0A9K3ED10_HELAN|nr:hypothetical protein HanXRQr2_Chr14g0661561 [Helianthus annuus]KAJ0841832.1 hypothetical protein HanPSC8_Chr14g0634811 [Helianthus annuus]
MPKSVPATQLPELKKNPFTNLCVSVYELPVKSDAAVDALKIFHNHRGRYRLESVNGSCRYTELIAIFVLFVCSIMPIQAKFHICTISITDILETC